MGLFDILGPVMVGPSSSHTAGAVRIALTARRLLGEEIARAEIGLCGSFALTGSGHGTDRALVAGLLGMEPDDLRIPDSFALARREGLSFSFHEEQLRGAHPNTAHLALTGRGGASLDLVAESIGGGRIRVAAVNGIDVSFSGEHNTLIVQNQDSPGHVVAVASALAERGVNIATMQLYRSGIGGRAVMVLECDEPIPQAAAEQLSGIAGIERVTVFNQEEKI